MSALERQRRYRAKYPEKAKEKYKDSAKKWRRKNPQKSREACKKYYEKNKERINSIKRMEYDAQKSRDSMRKYKYGISPEQYAILSEVQSGVCAICKKPQINKRSNQLFVDHHHSTGKVRGLLCHKCNATIGFVDENVETLLNAINYLEKYE